MFITSLFISNVKVLNLFKYLTFRSGCALATSLFITFTLFPWFINKLKQFQAQGQPIREDGPPSHLITKKGTPTMGGLLVIVAAILSTILWADLKNPYIWITLFVTFSFGALGVLDDYSKLKLNSSHGIRGKTKLFWQFLVSFIATAFVSKLSVINLGTGVALPFFKEIVVDLGVFYFLFTGVVITGASNAVNLTDGLDGLAIGAVIIATSCFALISYLAGNAIFANYLQIHHVPEAGELSILCSALIGAGLGFLWYNAPPAKVFMGDVGSLALGGALGIISVITKHELVLLIIGGLFVIEALSVILQVFYFKRTGRRIFKMAPLHHHFEKHGWSEPTIVVRFWILCIVFALLGLSTLKLR